MKKADINNNLSKYKAINAFIFAGSFSVGVIKAGFDLKCVLEIADDQLENNAYYFKKNVEDVPVILPSKWENDAFLDKLGKSNIDLMCCNCPCSSLSQINRNAKVDGKNNIHFYRLFNIFEHVKPKAFVIENAPTLIKLGLPILKDMVKRLGSEYRFTIIRDYAGQHEVPMRRERTLVVGWNRNHFSSIPLLKVDAHEKTTVEQTIGDLYNIDINDHPSDTVDELNDMYSYIDNGYSFMTNLAMKWMKHDAVSKQIEDRLKDTSFFKEVKRIADKIENKRSFWDKSPYRLKDDGLFPSLTSVTEYIHPKFNRTLNLKELARIMNYPDAYDFTNDGTCKIPVTQAIAQGVPANFGKYIANQVKIALDGNQTMLEDTNIDVVFQHNIQCLYNTYTLNEFDAIEAIEVTNKNNKLD